LASANEKYTVVIVDHNRKSLRLVRDYLAATGQFEVVDFAFDGKQAVDVILQNKPDLLVIDLILPELDCFAVLEALRSMDYDTPTRIVMTLAVGLDFVLKRAETFGVDYIFLKPFDKNVFQKRVLEMMEFRQDQKGLANNMQNANAIDIVTKLIKMAGVTANVKGYHYLRDAILMVYEDFGLINRLTTDLYGGIAKKYDSTPSRVERAMRHAIETAFGRADIDVLESLFGYTIMENKGKPTNGEFIAMLADKLATELKYVD